MSEISGKLLADLNSNGTERMVFIPTLATEMWPEDLEGLGSEFGELAGRAKSL